METTKYAKSLYKKGSGGKVKAWHIEVYESSAGLTYERTRSGYLGGKLKTSSKPSPGDAVKKAGTKAEKKIREGYVGSVEEAESALVTLSGMQAKWFTLEEIKSMKMRKIIDEKYNGIRGTYHLDSDQIISKGGLPYNVAHVQADAKAFCLEYGYKHLDFEMWAPGYPVNEIQSMVKSVDNPDRNLLVAIVFDGLVSTDDQRIALDRRKKLNTDLRDWYKRGNEGLQLPAQLILPSALDIQSFWEQLMHKKSEGMMVRDADQPYQWDNKSRRSSVLGKCKPLLTEEFLAVGCSFEKRLVDGEWLDLILYTCQNKEGRSFTVTPEGDVRSRAIPAPEFDENSWYIVEFREYTVNNLPFHGVGKGFRMVEDMDLDT